MTETNEAFPELATLELNIYNELLRAFLVVARLRTGQSHATAGGPTNVHLLAQLETHNWLLDYYQVHIDLVGLHLAAVAANSFEVAQFKSKIDQYATSRHMPFFQRIAQLVKLS